MNISELKKQDASIVAKFKNKMTIQRWFYDNVDLNEKCIGLVGMRWIGKTTFLLQKRVETPNSLYISCDLIQLRKIDLLEIIDSLQKTYWIHIFFLDEIHFLENWDWYLKNIYDFLDVHIIFSGSNMIDITKWWYDLSRRAVVYNVPVFSFAEYIQISKNIPVKNYKIQDILANHIDIATENSLRYTKELQNEYLQYGQFGYWYENKNEEIFKSKLDNSIRKVIFEDITNFISIWTENLNKLVDLLFFLCNGWWTSSITTWWLAKKLNINFKTAENYVDFLERAWILHRIYPYWNLSDTLRKEKKLFPSSTNMLYLFGDNIWFVRESFFVSCLQKNLFDNFRKKIHYQSQTDFILELEGEKYFFEIWGKWKSRSDKNLFVVKDDITIGQLNNIPLWLFGLL